MNLKNYSSLILIFLIVFLSRVPFLFPGFGIEEDSWGIALAALHTKASGIYEPSRFPGHPVQELIYSAIWGAGAIAFNGLCAFFSAIGAVFFALILKQLQFKHYFIAALALAFIPVYYISSTYTIDFVWTEAFVLISFYCLLKNNFIASGIFLGLAIGCRITSGAMIVPFMIIIWQQNNLKQNLTHFVKIILPAMLIAILAFSPLIQQFGASFFHYYDQFPYPPFTKVLYKMTIGVLGVAGFIAVTAAVTIAFFKREKQNSGALFNQAVDKKIIIAAYVTIALYTISYFRLPQKAGYMIPILPFIILLFGYYLNSSNFKLLCFALIISPFICSINLTDKLRGAEYSGYALTHTISGQELFFDPFTGPIFSDHSKRKQKIKYSLNVILKTDTIQSKTVIIAGWWYNEIMVMTNYRPKNEQVIFEPYINENKINKYKSEGYQLFYLPEQNIYNDLMYKMNITSSSAELF